MNRILKGLSIIPLLMMLTGIGFAAGNIMADRILIEKKARCLSKFAEGPITNNQIPMIN